MAKSDILQLSNQQSQNFQTNSNLNWMKILETFTFTFFSKFFVAEILSSKNGAKSMAFFWR